MIATVAPLRLDSARARSARSRNSSRLASPLNGSCSDSCSCLIARRALRWTASSGIASRGRRNGEAWTAITPTGASATRTPEVVAWKRKSSRRMSTTCCLLAIATTAEISQRLTPKKTTPAARAAPRCSVVNGWYEAMKGSPASLAKTARAATRVSTYWLKLNRIFSGLRRPRMSSRSTAAHCTAIANPIGPVIRSISAEVVEMVI